MVDGQSTRHPAAPRQLPTAASAAFSLTPTTRYFLQSDHSCPFLNIEHNFVVTTPANFGSTGNVSSSAPPLASDVSGPR
uniref:Uncharacterized protein n=1 Tax=Aegilops tauschii subsp. strangulata TaxID=200361 RepID=A0A453DXK4_AEGTS